MSGIIKMVHRSDDPDGPFKTVSEVAEYLECSRDTVRRWSKRIGIPTHKMQIGEHPNNYVWLYTEEDIESLSAFGEEIKRSATQKGGKDVL